MNNKIIYKIRFGGKKSKNTLKCKLNTLNYGVETIFISLNDKDAIKIFPTKKEAINSCRRQRKAAKFHIGPKVYSSVQKCYVDNLKPHDGNYIFYRISGNCATNYRKFGYFYKTQIAETFMKLCKCLQDHPEYDKLWDKMKELEFEVDDLHENNIGLINDKLVCIDFGSKSVT